jgi:uncharacterized membrane protein
MAPSWKGGLGATPSWVQIPHLPPIFKLKEVMKKIIFYSLLLCAFLGFVRVSIAGNSDYLFLPWNICLGLVPLLIALKFKDYEGYRLWALALIWLFFLPNSFYVVTDLIHLNSAQVFRESITGPYISYDNIGYMTIVYDALYLFTCSLISFWYGLESIRLFKLRFSSKFDKSVMKIVLGTAFFLSGIAIYLGRFVRLNSWDVAVRPWKIVADILDLFVNPGVYKKEWLVVLSFSFVVASLYYFYDLFLNTYKISKK